MEPLFSPAQVEQLLKPINPRRVMQRAQAGRTFSYLAQHDVRAMLIRIFGFGGFDLRTLNVDYLHREQNESGRWHVVVSVTMELSVHGDNLMACVFSETAVAESTQPRLGEALDMAVKSASSDAMKRCAVNLGDQFGLSLYNDGSTRPFVGALLDADNAPEPTPEPDDSVPDVRDSTDGDAAPEPEELLEDMLNASPIDQGKALTELRAIAPMPDAQRLPALVAWQQEWNQTGVLDTTTNLAGQQITVGRLVERVMAGDFVKEES